MRQVLALFGALLRGSLYLGQGYRGVDKVPFNLCVRAPLERQVLALFGALLHGSLYLGQGYRFWVGCSAPKTP